MKPQFETVGDIRQGNSLFAFEETSLFEAASELVRSQYTGMPVVNKMNQVIGMVSEQDILRAFRGPTRIEDLRIKNIMTRAPLLIQEDTTLEEASKLMDDLSIHRLPVIKDGMLSGTITRHDLVRAWLGLPLES